MGKDLNYKKSIKKILKKQEEFRKTILKLLDITDDLNELNCNTEFDKNYSSNQCNYAFRMALSREDD